MGGLNAGFAAGFEVSRIATWGVTADLRRIGPAPRALGAHNGMTATYRGLACSRRAIRLEPVWIFPVSSVAEEEKAAPENGHLSAFS